MPDQIDPPDLQDHQGNQHVDQAHAELVEDGQVAVDPRLQGRIALLEIGADRKAAPDQRLGTLRQRATEREEKRADRGAAGHQLEPARNVQRPHEVGADQEGDRQQMPDAGEKSPHRNKRAAHPPRAARLAAAQPGGHRLASLQDEDHEHEGDHKAARWARPCRMSRGIRSTSGWSTKWL
jgi:hypothetical protein